MDCLHRHNILHLEVVGNLTFQVRNRSPRKNPVKGRTITDRSISNGLVIFVLLSCALPHAYAGEKSAHESPQQWEDIASIRLQVAISYESKAEKMEALENERPGEALLNAGDAKVLASSHYKRSGEHWEKAANAHETAGDLDSKEKAQYNADMARKAAERTLREGADLHARAARLYENTNNLDGKIKALEKVAGDLEALMKME